MKRMTRNVHVVGALVSALAVGACGDSTGLDGLDDTLVLDMALLAADATLEDVTMWTQPLGVGPLLAEGPDGPAMVGRPGGHGDFTGEFSGTRAVTFYDEAGVAQTGFDPLLTESIHFIREIEGEITRDNFSASISRTRDMTVSGLLGAETHRTWNGSGSEEMSRSGVMEDGTPRSHESSGSFEFEDIVVPIPGSATRYPVSGTIRRSMTATRTTADGTVTREVEVVITFDGTSIAQAVVNGDPVEIDLSTREGRNPLRPSPR